MLHAPGFTVQVWNESRDIDINSTGWYPSQALMFAGKEPFPTIYLESQKEGEVGLEYRFLIIY